MSVEKTRDIIASMIYNELLPHLRVDAELFLGDAEAAHFVTEAAKKIIAASDVKARPVGVGEQRLVKELRKSIASYEMTGNGNMRHVEMLRDCVSALTPAPLSAAGAAWVLLADDVVLRVMAKAARHSQAVDDEGTFPPLFDLLDFSSENKTKTVVDAAIRAALKALTGETQ